MKDLKKIALKKVEKRARKVFPYPSNVTVNKEQGLITLLCGLITIINNDSFANIERDMYHFSILQDKDFRFFTENPNGRKYHLAKGFYDTSMIEARLITDGVQAKSTMYSYGGNSIVNPLNPDRKIRLTESSLEELELEEATFAIEQYLVGGRVEFLRFISEIKDREELKRIASYIELQKSQKNISVLALRKDNLT